MSNDRIPTVIRWTPFLIFLLGSAAVAQTICTANRRSGDEAPFLTSSDAAMTKMMDGMVAKPTGNVDVDFSAMMIPHHQGAIEMAEAELRFGHNEKLRRIAQEIIVDQQGEIAAMRLALGQALPPSVPAPTGGQASGSRAPGFDASRHSATVTMEFAR